MVPIQRNGAPGRSRPEWRSGCDLPKNAVRVKLSSQGTKISGFLGFDTLHMLQLKIDYRDGLVDFVYDASPWH
jgi:hypothetical protein